MRPFTIFSEPGKSKCRIPLLARLLRSSLMRAVFANAGLLLMAVYPPARAADLSRGEDRLGVVAPRLELQHWLHSPRLEMDALRGKVVLIRWWTEGCPFCVATAPALRELDRKYGHRGLQVIGIFHPKPAGDWSVERMQMAGERLGFNFPVALDGDWTALRRWWPDLEKRGWTSVSFVVDKTGVIRYVHPGGEFHEGRGGNEAQHAQCEREYGNIDRVIQRLLAGAAH
jgi:thiol-disulfide isomerase/thioredoxin